MRKRVLFAICSNPSHHTSERQGIQYKFRSRSSYTSRVVAHRLRCLRYERCISIPSLRQRQGLLPPNATLGLALEPGGR